MSRIKARARKKQKVTNWQWIQAALIVVGVLLLFISMAALKAFNKPLEKAEIQGLLVGVHQTQSQYTSRSYLIVELDEGGRVMIDKPGGHIYRQNAEVVLQKSTMAFGGPKYSWLRYVPDEQSGNRILKIK